MSEHTNAAAPVADKRLPKGWWANESWALSPEAARSLANIETQSQAQVSLPGAKVDTIEAVIPIVGLLGVTFWGFPMGSSYEGIRAAVAAAMADERVKSIRFEVDSPGGLVKGAHETSRFIALCDKPTKAVISGEACSAAYWSVAGVDEIEIAPTAITGSVGTAISFFAPEGREDYYVDLVASQSPRKRADPRSEDGRAQYQAILDAQADVFIRDVAAGRGVDYAEVFDKYGSGAILSAPDALKAGMVDKIIGADTDEAPSSSGGEDMSAQANAQPTPEQQSAEPQAAAVTPEAAPVAEPQANVAAPEPAAQESEPQGVVESVDVVALQQQLADTQAALAAAEASAEATAEVSAEELATLQQQLADTQAALAASTPAAPEPALHEPEPQAVAESVDVVALQQQLADAQTALAAAEEKRAAAEARAAEAAQVKADLEQAKASLEQAQAQAKADLEAAEAKAKADLDAANAQAQAAEKKAVIGGLRDKGFLAPAEEAVAAHTYDTNRALFDETYGSRTQPVVDLGTVHAHGQTPRDEPKDPRARAIAAARAECKRRGIPAKGHAYVAILNAAMRGAL